jgi:hypothetical protein
MILIKLKVEVINLLVMSIIYQQWKVTYRA